MVTKKQTAQGLFWSTVERAATQGISFVVVFLLARLLGPHNYGLVTLAATIALFAQMLLGETFSQALIQEKTLEDEHVSSLFWLLTAFGLLAAAVQFVAADALAAFFGEADVAPILRALCLLPLLTALQAVPSALFRRELKFRVVAAASTSGTLLGGVVGVSLAFAGFGVWSLVANLLTQNVIVTLTMWHKSEFRPKLAFSQPHMRALWSYGKYTFLLRISAFTANQSPRLIVGYLFGATALGAFGLGLRIVEILYQLLSVPATNVILPAIARIRDDAKRRNGAILTATQLTALLSVPAYVGIAITAPIAFPLLFGAKWTSSVPIIQILCIYGVVGSCGLIWQSILGGLGRPDIALMTSLAAAVTSVTAMAVGARWGVIGAAGAFVVRGYATLPFMPVVIARLTGLSAFRQYRDYAPILLAGGLMGGMTETVIVTLSGKIPPFEVLALAMLAGAAVYAATLFASARPALKTGYSFLTHLKPGQSSV
jgi:O-antigen/teichoic acid export membrane protein